MFMNPYISGELARERQRDMLATAEHQQLARQFRAQRRTAESGERLGRRLRSVLRAAARPRAVPGT